MLTQNLPAMNAITPPARPDAAAAVINPTQQAEFLPPITRRAELVLISNAIANYTVLLNALDPALEVHIIDSQQDALAQIADLLTGRSDVQALHIISHGAEGLLDFGALKLSSATIAEHASALARIGNALPPHADILLYGCAVGAGDAGAAFIQALAAATQVNIAASDDATGAAARGGDWALEVTAGQVTTPSLALTAYTELLAAVNFTGDTGDTNNTAATVNAGAKTSISITDNATGYALQMSSVGTAMLQDTAGNLGDTPTGMSGLYLKTDAPAWATALTFSVQNNQVFDFSSLQLQETAGNTPTFIFTSNKGSASFSFAAQEAKLIDLSSNSNFQHISRVTLTVTAGGNGGAGFQANLDDISLNNIQLPPTITAASYDASSHSLSVTAANLSAGDLIDTSKLTLSGAGGSYTLADVYNISASSSTAFSVSLTASDSANVAALLDKNGLAASDNTPYNLAAAADWDRSTGAPADLSSNALTVSKIPTITGSSYDEGLGLLRVTGTDFEAKPGTANDIAVSKLTLTGEGGNSYTLTSSAVEIDSASQFTVPLNSADQLAVNGLLNKTGTAAVSSNTYRLAAADDWNANHLAGNTANSNIGVTVSHVIAPTISSATYDVTTGVLRVTGANLVKQYGGNNDIDVSKLSLSGEGGSLYTLTSAAVELTSASDFSVPLNATDSAALNLILNKNGLSASGGSTYNLVAVDNWNGVITGADIADATLNPLNVSNVAVPVISNAVYDAASGTLLVTGSGFLRKAGVNNDIVANAFSLTGEGGVSYTVTDTANVDVSSGTSFTLSLSANDKAAINQLINQNGALSTSANSYNLSAAEDWAAGADAALVIADVNGNTVSANNVAIPSISSASYDVASGQLIVQGSGFLSRQGAANDILANTFALIGEGGSVYTLTDTPNVDISSATTFALILSAADQAAIAPMLNKNGTTASGGVLYSLSAAEDWAAGASPAVVVADNTAHALSVSNVPIPSISSASYNAATGVLTVTGSGLLDSQGSANDIVSSKFTISGQGGQSYTLSSTANVDINSSTEFALTLADVDQTALQHILDQAGSSASDGNYYNLAAAEDWIAGADAALTVADLSGNSISVAPLVPQVTDAQISLSGATGAGGKFIIGDTLTVTWNNSASGDNNRSITQATVDFSAFGGDSAVSMTNVNDIWSATYRISRGNLNVSERNIAVTAADNAGNATTTFDSSNSSIDNIPPTVIISSDKATLSTTDTAALSFTFSEPPQGFDASDVLLSAGTLTALQVDAQNSNVYHALYTPAPSSTGSRASGSISVLAGAYRDSAGNAAEESSTLSFGDQPGGDTVNPGQSTENFAGVTVTQSTRTTQISVTDPNTGASHQVNAQVVTTTVPVITAAQTPNAPTVDVALVRDSAGNVLVDVGVPAGIGLSAEAIITADSSHLGLLELLTQAVASRTAEQPDFQPTWQESIAAYVSSVSDPAQVTLRSISFSADTAALSASATIALNGASIPGHQEALVLDLRNLPAGTRLQLNHVEFAIVLGATRVQGGDGKNIVVGDDSEQFMVLGADDDVLNGGSGNDTIGSLDGNDQIYGDAGDDTLYGGYGNDLLSGGSGNDQLNGGSGYDIALQPGALSDYRVAMYGTGLSLIDNQSSEHDQFTDVEQIHFANGPSLAVAYSHNEAIAAQLVSTWLYRDLSIDEGVYVQQNLEHASTNAVVEAFLTIPVAAQLAHHTPAELLALQSPGEQIARYLANTWLQRELSADETTYVQQHYSGPAASTAAQVFLELPAAASLRAYSVSELMAAYTPPPIVINLDAQRELNGTAGNDTGYVNWGLAQTLDEGAGFDVLRIHGAMSDVHLAAKGDTLELTRLQDGAMLNLSNAELLLFDSGEQVLLAHTAQEAMLGHLAQTLFNRSASQSEWQHYTQLLQQGTAPDMLLNELQQQAQLDSLSAYDYVQTLYQNTLGTVDSSVCAQYQALLEQGVVDRNAVAVEIANLQDANHAQPSVLTFEHWI